MKKREFSKTLLIQESVLVWITTLVCLFFGYLCITMGALTSLPWISSIIVSVYAAYGVSQAMYYKKAMAENTSGGVKYESIIKEIEDVKKYYTNASSSIDINNDITSSYTASDDIDSYQI